MERPKLSIPQQIADMESKGIAFNYISKEEAKRFLENNTYYFKLKAYSKNYFKNSAGQYCGLDFAYLIDLSTIDAHLRKFIIKMTLDIEHFLKVKLLRDFSLIGDEDGYTIVEDLFRNIPSIKEDVLGKMHNSYCFELIEKYKDEFAIWNVIEVLSFGQFIELYKLFYARHKFDNDMSNMLLPVKFLRNAAAHNNCLINKLGGPYTRDTAITANQLVNRYVSQIPGISNKVLTKKMSNPAIHDFVVMLYVFCAVVTSKDTKTRTLIELQQLIDGRMKKNKEYYQGNELIASYYHFVKKVVDFLCEMHIMNV